jgi:predicted nucleic acid-binding protein
VNVVDSSGWLEYLAEGPNSQYFAEALEATTELIVPTLSVYEVYRRVLAQRDEEHALQAIALMYQGMVVDLTATIAIDAARASAVTGLAMADSIMLTTARAFDATLWTQDADFAAIDGVRYVAKKRP